MAQTTDQIIFIFFYNSIDNQNTDQIKLESKPLNLPQYSAIQKSPKQNRHRCVKFILIPGNKV